MIHQNIRNFQWIFDTFLINLLNIIILIDIWIKNSDINLFEIESFLNIQNCNESHSADRVFVSITKKLNFENILAILYDTVCISGSLQAL